MIQFMPANHSITNVLSPNSISSRQGVKSLSDLLVLDVIDSKIIFSTIHVSLNIATQERRVCDMEIELVAFVIQISSKLTTNPDRQE